MATNLRLENILDAPVGDMDRVSTSHSLSIAPLQDPKPKEDNANRPLPVEPSKIGEGPKISSNALLKPRSRGTASVESAKLAFVPPKARGKTADGISHSVSLLSRRDRSSGSKAAVPLAEVLNRSSTPDIAEQRRGKQDREERGSRKRPRLDPEAADFVHLPKPPAQKSQKPPRIPPLLQGLHEPPPNAALFPPITTDTSFVTLPSITPRPAAAFPPPSQEKPASDEPPNDDKAPISTEKVQSKRDVAPRKKWTNEETRFLLKGVAKFGIGSWKKILAHPEFKFNGRTAVDLRDRFRVCRPEDYTQSKHRPSEKSKKRGASQTSPVQTSDYPISLSTLLASPDSESTTPPKRKPPKAKSTRSHEKDDADLASLGINAPFSKSTRRDRRPFSNEEDDALITGFEKYGASWSEIRKDASLGLSARTPRDLRDRLRNKYPDKYAQGGRKLPPEKTSKPPGPDSAQAAAPENNNTTPEKPATSSKDIQMLNPSAFSAPTASSATGTNASAYPPRPQSPPLHLLPQFLPDFFPDDPFAHVDSGEGGADPGGGAVVLDRSIFDWVNQNHGALVTHEGYDGVQSRAPGPVTPGSAKSRAAPRAPVEYTPRFIDPLVTWKPASGLF